MWFIGEKLIINEATKKWTLTKWNFLQKCLIICSEIIWNKVEKESLRSANQTETFQLKTQTGRNGDGFPFVSQPEEEQNAESSESSSWGGSSRFRLTQISPRSSATWNVSENMTRIEPFWLLGWNWCFPPPTVQKVPVWSRHKESALFSLLPDSNSSAPAAARSRQLCSASCCFQ